MFIKLMIILVIQVTIIDTFTIYTYTIFNNIFNYHSSFKHWFILSCFYLRFYIKLLASTSLNFSRKYLLFLSKSITFKESIYY
jgi:hypothetical protein